MRATSVERTLLDVLQGATQPEQVDAAISQALDRTLTTPLGRVDVEELPAGQEQRDGVRVMTVLVDPDPDLRPGHHRGAQASLLHELVETTPGGRIMLVAS